MARYVWVVDDDPIFRMIICHGIRKMAPDTAIKEIDDLTEFDSGDGTLRFAPDDNPDVVFLDINLPGIDAWGFLDLIHQDDSTGFPGNARIVVISSSINPHDASRAMSYPRVKSFLSKPVGDDELLLALS